MIISEIKIASNIIGSSLSPSLTTESILPTKIIVSDNDIDPHLNASNIAGATASSVPTRLKQQTGSFSKFILNDSSSFNNTTTNTDLLSLSSSSSLATQNAYLNGHNLHGAVSTSGVSTSYISDMSGVDLSMDSVVERFNEE